MTPPRTRFAPSPTGFLHLGHAFSALTAQSVLRSRPGGGRGAFVVRIEDIDATRCRPRYVDAIFEDLAWLGLSWEPQVRRQSAHLAEFRAALGRLQAAGLLYPCFCTRKEIVAAIADIHRAPHGRHGPLYPGTCRRLSQDERGARTASGAPYALRLDMEKACAAAPGPLTWTDLRAGAQTVTPQIFGDVALARKDTPTSYHLSVCHDDALQGVTVVTRGEDLFAATHLHRLLQALMGWPTPLYHHHGLKTGPDGERYSKRDSALTLASLRARGVSAAEARARLGF